MSNTPSNKDIDLLVRAYLGDCGPQANHVYAFVTAVLAIWGTPQSVARDTLSEVATKFESMHTNGDVWITTIAAAQLVRQHTEGGQHGTDT